VDYFESATTEYPLFQHILGVAGFAAAADYFYFAAMAEYFMVDGYYHQIAVNNTDIRASNGSCPGPIGQVCMPCMDFTANVLIRMTACMLPR
jgi:hypothetical protein